MKKMVILALVLALVGALAVPAQAAFEYALVYDASEKLDQDYCADVASPRLVELSEKYQTQVRVDLVNSTEEYEVQWYAKAFYESFEYGYGESLDGILLMIHAEKGKEDLSFVDYAVYCGGERKEELDGFLTLVHQELEPWLNAEKWAGDMAGDDAAFQGAVAAFADCAEGFLSGELAPIVPETTAPTETESLEERYGKLGNYVWDETQLLAYEDWVQLEFQAELVSRRNQCGVYVAVVEDAGAELEDAARDWYEQKELGVGEEKDGILLMISTNDGGYGFYYQGLGGQRIREQDREEMSKALLKSFGEEKSFEGLSQYIESCDGRLGEEPSQLDTLLPVGLSLGVAAVALVLLLRKKKQ